MNQREAVYSATKSVLKDATVSFEDGNNINTVMTEDFRKRIHAIVVSAFKEGKVEFKATASNDSKLANESELSSYVSGLISNWFRKDKRFNGNTTYSAKNPGSRAGQGASGGRPGRRVAGRDLPRRRNGRTRTTATLQDH